MWWTGVVDPGALWNFREIGFSTPLGFWLSAICFGFLFNMPIYWAVRLFGEPIGVPIWLIILASAVIAAVPTTILVNGIAMTFLTVTAADSFIDLYPMVLVIGIPLQALGHFTSASTIQQARVKDLEPANFEASVAKPVLEGSGPEIGEPPIPLASISTADGMQRFLRRLPKSLGTTIQCLQMEDHYLRVYTPLGSDLILMRMSDAALELESLDGLMVHRSFWVARAAVIGWTRDGKSLVLHLESGKNVPVARDRQSQLKSLGWLLATSSVDNTGLSNSGISLLQWH